jgi:hypothetical protein
VTATLGERSANGHVATRPIALAPAKTRRVRLPELALGILIVAGGALAAVLWQASSVEREPVLAIRQAVERGEALTADDVRVVFVSTDDPISYLTQDQLPQVLGRVAAADLLEGTLLASGLLLEGAAVDPGEGVVGLALEPGQVPTATLRSWDVVNVVDAASDGSGGAVVAERAEVYAVEELPAEGRVFVSLAMNEVDANAVAAAADGGALRLVLVSR